MGSATRNRHLTTLMPDLSQCLLTLIGVESCRLQNGKDIWNLTPDFSCYPTGADRGPSLPHRRDRIDNGAARPAFEKSERRDRPSLIQHPRSYLLARLKFW